MATPNDEPQGFDCDRCSRCCKVHRVPLTSADVGRLVSAGQDAAEFVEFLEPEEVDMTGEPESFAQLKGGRRALFLRHKPNEGGCVFLQPGGCGVHPSRPSACRTYPYDRPDTVGSLGSAPGYLCPSETGVLVTLRRDASDHTHGTFVSALRKRDGELSRHADFIQSWNRRQRLRVRLGHAPESEAKFLARLLRDSGHHP